MAKALELLVPGTPTARSPVIGLGSAMVAPQLIWLGLKVIVPTRFRVIALLVPPEVTTVTLTVPGAVSVEGTSATAPVSDQAEPAGTTSIEVLPCLKLTFPGAAWKPLPLISIGRPTGLAGVVELLIFWICGTGGGVLLPPLQLDKRIVAATISAALTAITSHCLFMCVTPSKNDHKLISR